MWKVGLIGVVAAFLAMPLKRLKPEFAAMTGLCAGLIIFIFTMAKLSYAINFIKEIVSRLPIANAYLIQLLKMLGVSYASDFSANLCRDCGYQSIAGQIELFAKISIVILSIPGIELFIEVLEKFI